MTVPPLNVRRLGQRPYLETWRAMRDFTDQRDAAAADELWLLEHPPVFTQGLAGKPEHVLNPGDTPVIQTDRGGQVTWHGPGQLVMYPLLDLDRIALGVRCLVDRLEQIIIDLLAEFDLRARRKDGAPGVYLDGAKIASIGLKVRRGRTYHGMAFNISNELTPFGRINPCGYADQRVTRLADHVARYDRKRIEGRLVELLASATGLQFIVASGPEPDFLRHAG
ncbi:MAG: lipoyl(octanoyl) transferase LipB [Wenzhouxiangellaceae bacterium]